MMKPLTCDHPEHPNGKPAVLGTIDHPRHDKLPKDFDRRGRKDRRELAPELTGYWCEDCAELERQHAALADLPTTGNPAGGGKP